MPTTTTNYSLYKPLINDPVDEDLWGGYLNDNMDAIDTQMKVTADNISAIVAVPIGGLIDWAGSSAPTGYLFCYGQSINRVTYASLFAILGTTYGVGDGSTTFGLPDLRGRVVAGKDDMGGSSANRLTGLSGGVNGDTLGGTGGAESHTLTTSEIPAHTHVETASDSGGGSRNCITRLPTGSAGSQDTTDVTGSTGGGAAHNNIQPTIILNKIIRAL